MAFLCQSLYKVIFRFQPLGFRGRVHKRMQGFVASVPTREAPCQGDKSPSPSPSLLNSAEQLKNHDLCCPAERMVDDPFGAFFGAILVHVYRDGKSASAIFFMRNYMGRLLHSWHIWYVN